MDYICPVCNGITTLTPVCSKCGAFMSDAGPLSDYYGEYSPYRNIDDVKRTNGYRDLANHQCLHVSYCINCQNEAIVPISEVEGLA